MLCLWNWKPNPLSVRSQSGSKCQRIKKNISIIIILIIIIQIQEANPKPAEFFTSMSEIQDSFWLNILYVSWKFFFFFPLHRGSAQASDPGVVLARAVLLISALSRSRGTWRGSLFLHWNPEASGKGRSPKQKKKKNVTIEKHSKQPNSGFI